MSVKLIDLTINLWLNRHRFKGDIYGRKNKFNTN